MKYILSKKMKNVKTQLKTKRIMRLFDCFGAERKIQIL